MKKIIAICLLVLSCQSFAAGNVANAKIINVRVDDNGKAMIIFDRDVSGTPPGCVHSAYKNAFAIDASTDGGKAVLALALSTMSRKANISVYGQGVCGVYGGSYIETWSYGVSS
ncbi:MAG: hypothetical protein OQK04_15685 [Kangiellaceae bacterium]|nr:hypothetical protein [Kangiellaceae bacterium]MCW9000149.1 hypothetical protein [Kangiellaceae bacterium]